MKYKHLGLLITAVLLLSGAARSETFGDLHLADLAAQVRAAETAFARSMAERDIEAFASLLADEALLFDKGCPNCE